LKSATVESPRAQLHPSCDATLKQQIASKKQIKASAGFRQRIKNPETDPAPSTGIRAPPLRLQTLTRPKKAGKACRRIRNRFNSSAVSIEGGLQSAKLYSSAFRNRVRIKSFSRIADVCCSTATPKIAIWGRFGKETRFPCLASRSLYVLTANGRACNRLGDSRTVSRFRIWLVGATGIEPVTPPV
jgi:hypothetical protein